MSKSDAKRTDATSFLRVFGVRGPSLMWLFGAGTSISAGVPAAGNLIWEFKRDLYCSAQRIPISHCANLSDPVLQDRLQQYFDSFGSFPARDSDDEYSVYFEAMYPHEQDRRKKIEGWIGGATSTHAHKVVAALMRMGRLKVLWTTNFDRTVEDAAYEVFGRSGDLRVATLQNPDVAETSLHEQLWPLLVKLHGDFQSVKLKNTSAELREQDARLRECLTNASRSSGLAVIGYSGRDRSIMDTLEGCISKGAFPTGLFWFVRPGGYTSPSVEALIGKAREYGIDSSVIEMPTFEELFEDIITLEPAIPAEIIVKLESGRRRVADVPLPPQGSANPLLRVNAFPLTKTPDVFRHLHCDIGGTKDVRAALRAADARAVAVKRQGVIAFGADAEIRRAFVSYGIRDFDVRIVDLSDSIHVGLIYEALMRALERERPVRILRRGPRYIAVPDPARTGDLIYSRLQAAAKPVGGVVKGIDSPWWHACRMRIDFYVGRPWLILNPTVITELGESPSAEKRFTANAFSKALLDRMYNAKTDQLLNAWSAILLGERDVIQLRAFGIDDGVDATFELVTRSAYSRLGKLP